MSQQIAALLIEMLVKSTLVLAATWAIVTIARRLSSAERHLVWAAALVALLALPALSLLAPDVELPIEVMAVTPSRPPPPAADGRTGRVEPAEAAGRAGSSSPSASARPGAGSAGAPVVAGPSPLALAVAAYLGVAALVLVYFAIGVRRASRRAAALSADVSADSRALFDALVARHGIRRRVRLLVSDEDLTPWTSGLVRPVVVVPRAFERWPDAERRAALTHELCHIKRLDALALGLGYLVCAVYWAQPLAWLAARRMLAESENACDDGVLSAGAEHAGYAGQLLDLANRVYKRGAARAPVMAMAGGSPVAARVLAILNLNKRRQTVNKMTMTAVAAGTLGVLVPLAMVMPQELTLPAHDRDVEGAVTTLLEQDRRDEAVDLLAAWIGRDGAGPDDGSRCGFCVQQLKKVGTAAYADEEVGVVLDALHRVEDRAVDRGDGEALLELADLAVQTKHSPSVDRGMHYLLEAFVAGNFGGTDPRMTVMRYLIELGRPQDALALAREMHGDESSPFFESDVTQRWIGYLQTETVRSDTLARRLLALGTDRTSDTDEEYIPLVKTAPRYPEAAVTQRLEGDVIVQYTVTATGTVENPVVVSSTSPVFDEASLESVMSYLYIPRVVSGVPVDVPGVRTKITYRLE